MAKIRNNYEKSWFPRLLKWLDGGSGLLDDAMAHELDEGSEEHLLPDSQDALTRETKFEQHRQESLDKDETLYERYHQWAHTRGKKLLTWLYRLLAVVVCFSIIWVLLQTASYLPPFGNPDNPVNNEVSQRYIEKGMEETGAVNIVAGMILDYRAFDTLGESNVLFIAACSVLILLRVSGSKDGKPSTEQLEAEADDRMYEPKNDAILQHAANFLVPLILMFGVYVILNGHISPGGGFSGGAVLGAPLAHDFCVISLSDRLTPWTVIEKRLACAAMGDFCAALYNPSSKGRADYLQKAVRILLQNGKAPQTICGIVRNIGREGQAASLLTLAELENTAVDMFTTVYIGNAATRALGGKMVTPRGYRGV